MAHCRNSTLTDAAEELAITPKAVLDRTRVAPSTVGCETETGA